MRVLFAMFPAAAVTLALFCLMQYLITGSQVPPRLPDYPGLVHFVDLHRDTDPEDSSQSRPALPEQARLPEETEVVPPPVTASPDTPDFPELSLPRPGLAALDLGQGPYLAPPGDSILATRQPVLPDPVTAPDNSAPPSTETLASNQVSPGTPDLPVISGPAGAMSGDGSGSDEVIPLLRIDPAYPRKAAQSGKEGWVRIEFTITEHGTVVDPVVVEARPRRIFNRSALTAIRKWQFKPRLADGKPVSRKASQVIEFNLARR
jgi:TonB family protein